MRSLLLVALLPCPGALPVESEPVDLAFRPTEDARIELSFELTASLEVISQSWCPVVDGEPVEEEAEPIEAEDVTYYELRGTFVDRYVAVDDGRVTELVRTFEELGGTSEWSVETDNEYEDGESELATPLEGRIVRFEWSADELAYDATFDEADDPEDADEDVDALLLADLRADAFGAWFLPPGPVEPGDSWELSVEAWSDFIEFGGETWLGPVDEGFTVDVETADALRAESREARENAQGDVRCHLAEIREDGDVEVAVIEIEVDLKTRAETESTEEYQDGESAEIATTIEDWTEARGTCLWDVAAGRPLSIEFEATIRDVTVERVTSIEDGEAYTIEWTAVSDTAAGLKLVFEAR